MHLDTRIIEPQLQVVLDDALYLIRRVTDDALAKKKPPLDVDPRRPRADRKDELMAFTKSELADMVMDSGDIHMQLVQKMDQALKDFGDEKAELLDRLQVKEERIVELLDTCNTLRENVRQWRKENKGLLIAVRALVETEEMDDYKSALPSDLEDEA